MIFTKRSSPQINLFVKLKEHNILPFSSMRFLGNVFDPKLSGKKWNVTCKGKRLIFMRSGIHGEELIPTFFFLSIDS